METLNLSRKDRQDHENCLKQLNDVAQAFGSLWNEAMSFKSLTVHGHIRSHYAFCVHGFLYELRRTDQDVFRYELSVDK
jgi:hypothetical protein